MSPNSTIWTYVAAVALVASAVSCSAMSIEAEPVKVTHRNSGPRYDIDEVERTKLTGANLEQSQPAANQQPDETRSMMPPPPPPADDGSAEDGTAIGHVAIRRIFLFPMLRPGDWSQQDSDSNAPSSASQAAGREQEDDREPMPSMFAKPFWPFMTPARPSPSSHQDHERAHRPHLFGADEASRPQLAGERGDQDKAESGTEREMSPAGQPMFDPIQMMVDLMHQAINSQLAPNFTTDLNKDKADASGDNSPAESADERPSVPLTDLVKAIRPSAKNESREDIVEIEGKKYLRKTVVSRHVGENMVLMTRRLIFVPLNETDSTSSTTTDTVATTTTTTMTPTEQPTTTTPVARDSVTTETPEATHRVGANKPTPAGTGEPEAPSATEEIVSKAPPTPTTETPATASPPVTASSEQPTEPSVESVTKPEKPTSSWTERISDVVNKAAERLVEETASRPAAPADTETSNEKPVSSSPTSA